MNEASIMISDESDFRGKNEVNVKKTIFLFSPDPDFCTSFALLLQNRFQIVTTTRFEFIHKIANTLRPHIFIADFKTSEKIVEFLVQMKNKTPTLKIILLLDSWINYKTIESTLKKTVDAIYYQPIDLTDINKEIDLLLV
jgi:DNA-binding NarL/FixJ family response regulator